VSFAFPRFESHSSSGKVVASINGGGGGVEGESINMEGSMDGLKLAYSMALAVLSQTAQDCNVRSSLSHEPHPQLKRLPPANGTFAGGSPPSN
jgi:hypothetical protein